VMSDRLVIAASMTCAVATARALAWALLALTAVGGLVGARALASPSIALLLFVLIGLGAVESRSTDAEERSTGTSCDRAPQL